MSSTMKTKIQLNMLELLLKKAVNARVLPGINRFLSHPAACIFFCVCIFLCVRIFLICAANQQVPSYSAAKISFISWVMTAQTSLMVLFPFHASFRSSVILFSQVTVEEL